MSQLLIVHHTPSPAVQELLESALSGLAHPELAEIAASAEPVLSATAADALAARAFVLITPANIGYMSGALKHFFDTIYYPCLTATAGRSYGLVVHGNDDTIGAIRSVEKVTKGLGWAPVAAPVSVIGAPAEADRAAVADLAATVAASLLT